MLRGHRFLKPTVAVAGALLTLGIFVGAASSATLAPAPGIASARARRPSFEAAARAPQHEAAKARRVPQRGAAQPALLAHIPHDLRIAARPGGRKIIGTMPAGSRFYGEALTAWVLKTDESGRFGKVTLPYSGSRTTGWIRIAELELDHTPYSVMVDLSRHSISVRRFGKAIMRFRAATGAPGSPTPIGRYFVTDLVPIAPGSSFGSYAFGLSGIQTHLPSGWTGGDQLAIHGTSDPGSIGTSASAGCLRVSERSLQRLKRVVRLGTPVTIAD